MAITKFKLDIFSELERILEFKYEIVILSGIIAELNKIILEQRGKYKRAAKLGLAIIKAKNKTKDAAVKETFAKETVKKIKMVKSSGDVDDLLVAYSKKGYLILTQDTALKKRLSKPYLTIRQKKKVVLVS